MMVWAISWMRIRMNLTTTRSVAEETWAALGETLISSARPPRWQM